MDDGGDHVRNIGDRWGPLWVSQSVFQPKTSWNDFIARQAWITSPGFITLPENSRIRYKSNRKGNDVDLHECGGPDSAINKWGGWEPGQAVEPELEKLNFNIFLAIIAPLGSYVLYSDLWSWKHGLFDRTIWLIDASMWWLQCTYIAARRVTKIFIFMTSWWTRCSKQELEHCSFSWILK